MKNLVLFLGLMAFGLNSFANTCHGWYSSNTIVYSPQQVLNLPSGRKMKVYFHPTENLKDGDEIIVPIGGLGKSYKDLKVFTETSLSLGKAIFGLDLQGQGETFKLNPDLAWQQAIPAEYNVEDLIFVLKQLGQKYKLRIVPHSYGAGITLEALTQLQKKRIRLPITKVVLISGLAKNLDTYYADAMMSGQMPQIMGDLANPLMNVMGVPPAMINSYDKSVNKVLFTSNSYSQFWRDTLVNGMPIMKMWREMLSVGPNTMGNLLMGPSHMMANASWEDLAAWQRNPALLTQLVFTNIALINGSRNVNFLDYSVPIKIPKYISYKVVMAMNDSVVPNTLSQEFAARLQAGGYEVDSLMIPGETHYFPYGESMRKLFKSVVLD